MRKKKSKNKKDGSKSPKVDKYFILIKDRRIYKINIENNRFVLKDFDKSFEHFELCNYNIEKLIEDDSKMICYCIDNELIGFMSYSVDNATQEYHVNGATMLEDNNGADYDVNYHVFGEYFNFVIKYRCTIPSFRRKGLSKILFINALLFEFMSNNKIMFITSDDTSEIDAKHILTLGLFKHDYGRFASRFSNDILTVIDKIMYNKTSLYVPTIDLFMFQFESISRSLKKYMTKLNEMNASYV